MAPSTTCRVVGTPVMNPTVTTPMAANQSTRDLSRRMAEPLDAAARAEVIEVYQPRVEYAMKNRFRDGTEGELRRAGRRRTSSGRRPGSPQPRATPWERH